MRNVLFRQVMFSLATISALLVQAMSALAQPGAPNDARSAAELLPESCLAYAELADPNLLLTTLETHPVWQAIQDRPEYQKAVAGPGYILFQAVRTHLESQLEMSWREALDTIAGGGVAVAFDPGTQGVAVLIRSRDAGKLAATAKTLIRLGRQDAKSKGTTPLPEESYRGVAVYGNSNQRFAVVGQWLIGVSKDELGEKLVDAVLDGRRDSLSDSPRFKAAREMTGGRPTVWGWLNLGAVREAGLAKPLEKNQTENPIVELLAGGLLTNLRHTPFITASMNISVESVRLKLAAPHQADWVEEFREYWFGPGGNGVSEPALETDSTIFSLTTYRQVSEMWLRAGDLFGERMNDELAKADANLTTFFAGRDFGEDILGSFGPQLQIVVNRQSFENVTPKPAIKFPGFALTGQLKNPDTTKTELRRTYQSLVGFLNVVGAMNGNPQLDQDVEFYRDEKIYTAAFIPEADERNSDRARVQFNFSPSLAFAGDRFIIASTKQIARDLIDADAQRDGVKTGSSNTAMRLDAGMLSAALDDNREQLIAQNMIEKGHSREEAERELGIAFDVLKLLSQASLDLKTSGGLLQLELAIDTRVDQRAEKP